MGADVHVVMGRFNQQVLTDQRPNPGAGKGLALFGDKNIRIEDITFENVPDEFDLCRNYRLFSFLADVRGDVKPIRPLDELMAQTRAFIDWCQESYRTGSSLPESHPSTQFSFYCGENRFDDVFDIGDHSRVVHTVNTLSNFDYDQIAEREDYEKRNQTGETVYYRDLGGLTYREIFGEQYFKFLEYARRENWHFVIFGFDS